MSLNLKKKYVDIKKIIFSAQWLNLTLQDASSLLYLILKCKIIISFSALHTNEWKLEPIKIYY